MENINSKLYQQRQEDFIKDHMVVDIPVKDVLLKEFIHKNGYANIAKIKDKLQAVGCTELTNVIIVKQEINNQYSLVTGYKAYKLALALEIPTIKAVIIDINREHFINTYIKQRDQIIGLDRVRVPIVFLKHTPRKEKVKAKLNFYSIHKVFDKPIIIDRFCILKDGYITYLIAKKLNLKTVPCRYVY